MNEDDIGSKPWRNWSPEEILEWKQRPKKKRKQTRVEELNELFKRSKNETRGPKV